ncbi:fructosamine kinase [Arenivirga flava]|uniref:Fructosamine kinase n=1 Tax=Arenivirga flava TaxID=1930060 RepID=A0AA37UH28_9MICO|nr:fructosamine kinase [Arenivirga flava]
MDDVVIKERADAPEGFFEAEAAGLAWLAAAPAGAAIVPVIESGSGRIALARLREARPTPRQAEAFGRRLAATHAAGAAAFGAPPDGWHGPNFIGRRPQECRPEASWGGFFAEQRVLPFARIARAVGDLRGGELGRVIEACDRLRSGELDDDEAPARLHGDLWSGNVLWTADGAVLIDPAAHGGHRESDLAMLALFGLPHLDAVLAGYDAAHPLRRGWRDRVPLHQLHPLAVHAAGHGRHYGVALAEAADATLALPSTTG